jgi:hypothetical protein
MKLKKVLTLAFLIAICHHAFSQNATKYSNEFLTLGVGAKAMGMSNVNVAGRGDVYSGYWNPAGLTDIKDDLQVGFMHSAYFAGIANYDYLGIATKVGDDKALGFSIIRFGVDGILNTFDLIRNGEINYDRITQFSAVDYAFMLHYAQDVKIRQLNEFIGFEDAKVSFGGNAKLINRKAGPFATAWGFGFDAAFRVSGLKGGWSFGMMANDVTTTFNSWNMTFTDQQKDILLQTGNEIPINTLEITLPRFIPGVGKLFKFGKSVELYSGADFEITTDGKRNTLIRGNTFSIDPRLGLEGAFIPEKSEGTRVMLRMGVGKFQKELNNKGNQTTTFMPTVGIGIQIKDIFSIDYALTDIGDQSAALYSNVISIRFGINKGISKQ